MAETIFEVITATDCPRKGFDRVRPARFPKKKVKTKIVQVNGTSQGKEGK